MLEKFLEMLSVCDKSDYTLHYPNKYNSHYEVVFDDFAGFDDDWGEIERPFKNEDAIEQLCEWLEKNCNNKKGDFYEYYYFDGFSVEIGYSSYDI